MFDTNHLSAVYQLAKRAGERILSYADASNDNLSVRYKSNETPLTLADEVANAVVVEGLQALTPSWPIVSEEESIPPLSERKQWETYWLIDPLDGTRGFLDLRAEFTVNIALIHQHRPVMGVIYAPHEQVGYYASSGQGAYRLSDGGEPELLSAANRTLRPIQRIIFGRYMPDLVWRQHVADTFPGAELVSLNSSLKLCRLAEGVVDLYPRAGDISEWDVAAADCLLTESGGAMVDCSGQPLRYNESDCILCPPFVAVADFRQLADMQLGTLLNNPGESPSESTH